MFLKLVGFGFLSLSMLLQLHRLSSTEGPPSDVSLGCLVVTIAIGGLAFVVVGSGRKG